MRFADPGTTSPGVSDPFRRGCHSRTSSGYFVAIEFVLEGFFPLHAGQPPPFSLAFGRARHT